jgi:hypothetical protein
MTEVSRAATADALAEGAPYPFEAWERRTRWWAGALAALALLVGVLAAVVADRGGATAAVAIVLVVAPPVAMYVWQTRRLRRRRALLSLPFPATWEAVLQRDVVFFRALDAPEQRRFRQYVQVFLGEKCVTGVGARLDATTRVLVAASASIPIFGFPDWEWDQINEVLVYPNRFDHEFQFGDRRGHDILGMVGTGSLNRMMILSVSEKEPGVGGRDRSGGRLRTGAMFANPS